MCCNANKNHFGNPDSDDRQWQNYVATKAMVNEAQQQLREIHALKYIPDSYDAAYIDWGADPFDGAYNIWKIYVKSWEIIPKMIQPVADVPTNIYLR